MLRILLADDKYEIRSALNLFLQSRLDLEMILEARDMEHVMAQLEDAHPDLIILDWELPGRPTRERVSILRTLVPELKIIIINSRPELQQQVLAEGADAFVCKTDPPFKLLETIQKVIQNS